MQADFGEEQRALLERHATALYDAVVAMGSLRRADPRLAGASEELAAFELLLDLGLLAHDPQRDVYVPVDPTTVQARIVAPMGQQAASLLEESSRWSEAFSALGQSYRRSSAARNPVTEIRGGTNINRFLEAALEDTREELLTAQPARDRSNAGLAAAVERDTRTVQRGVRMRTLYQHSARRSTAIKDYVDQMSPYGAQVRTLDEFFNRMIVRDRSLALVPGAEVNDVAIAIHEPALVSYLADIFERYWERARPYDDQHATTTRLIAEDVRKMTKRMLVEGHSDPASAKRVGVSTRTYAGYIASLKEEYGVQTRFQLGYAMGQHGAGPHLAED